MFLTVAIEPLSGQAGYSARLTAPIELFAEAPTADEAHSRLSAMLNERLKNGLELRAMPVQAHSAPSPGGWLPDDELTSEWLQHMSEYRRESEAADLARLEIDAEARVAS